MQDREASKTDVATPWSGGGNVGARGHVEGTQFSHLVIKWLVYMHEIVHIAYACE